MELDPFVPSLTPNPVASGGSWGTRVRTMVGAVHVCGPGYLGSSQEVIKVLFVYVLHHYTTPKVKHHVNTS